MAHVTIRRNEAAWSRWHTAKYVIGVSLERASLPAGDDVWTETREGLQFTGTHGECEAVAVALEGTGLDVVLEHAAVVC